jgi:hypothetical protein
MSHDNRRQHPRYKISLSAEVTAGERSFTATTRDVSEGGACLESAYPLPEAADVEVALFVVVDGIEDANTPPLRIRATVQWAADNDEAPADSRHIGGLKFADMSDAQRQWLAGVVARTES